MAIINYKKQLFIGVGLALLLPIASMAGDLYKWTDQAGVIQYTQHPPQDRPYTTIKTSGVKVPATQPTAPASQDQPQSDTEAKAPEADLASKKPKDQTGEFLAAKQKNCEVATANKKTLIEKNRVSVRDEKGEQRILSQSEKDAQLRLIEEQIKTYCGK